MQSKHSNYRRIYRMMKVTQAKRPKNSQMSKEKLKVGIEVPEWEDALKRYLKAEGKM